jgi:hypothetical protein
MVRLDQWWSGEMWEVFSSLPIEHKIMLIRSLLEMRRPTRARAISELAWACHLAGREFILEEA